MGQLTEYVQNLGHMTPEGMKFEEIVAASVLLATVAVT